mmetsp:Transcript_35334/g.82445  ORF Transcript_35334/g.82445 Transcript_35334/m.82445 type:complete len:226 (-) Transcript_35334:923-1600(-)
MHHIYSRSTLRDGCCQVLVLLLAKLCGFGHHPINPSYRRLLSGNVPLQGFKLLTQRSDVSSFRLRFLTKGCLSFLGGCRFVLAHLNLEVVVLLCLLQDRYHGIDELGDLLQGRTWLSSESTLLPGGGVRILVPLSHLQECHKGFRLENLQVRSRQHELCCALQSFLLFLHLHLHGGMLAVPNCAPILQALAELVRIIHKSGCVLTLHANGCHLLLKGSIAFALLL